MRVCWAIQDDEAPGQVFFAFLVVFLPPFVL
jgi:hypothetical protein